MQLLMAGISSFSRRLMTVACLCVDRKIEVVLELVVLRLPQRRRPVSDAALAVQSAAWLPPHATRRRCVAKSNSCFSVLTS